MQQPEPASRSPARKVGELDNHGSRIYLALYWAQALGAQGKSVAPQARFKKLAATLAANEAITTCPIRTRQRRRCGRARR